jgi:hypothetical protein
MPPKEGEPTTKEMAGKKYLWCIHHMAWGVHSSQECRMGAARKDSATKDKKPATKDKAITYAAAAATFANPSFAAFLSELSDDEE